MNEIEAVGPKHFCFKCEAEKEGQYRNFKRGFRHQKRPHDNQHIDLTKNKVREALIKSIPTTNYVIPMLHIWLGVAVEVVKLIQKEVLRKDLRNMPSTFCTLQGAAKKGTT